MKADAKFYPTPYYYGMVNTERLSEEISHATTLTETDVNAVLIALVSQIMTHIESGYKIKLDNLGIFKLSFSGDGKENPSDVTARDIRDIHILFTPESKLKRAIKKFSFTKKNV